MKRKKKREKLFVPQGYVLRNPEVQAYFDEYISGYIGNDPKKLKFVIGQMGALSLDQIFQSMDELCDVLKKNGSDFSVFERSEKAVGENGLNFSEIILVRQAVMQSNRGKNLLQPKNYELKNPEIQIYFDNGLGGFIGKDKKRLQFFLGEYGVKTVDEFFIIFDHIFEKKKAEGINYFEELDQPNEEATPEAYQEWLKNMNATEE